MLALRFKIFLPISVFCLTSCFKEKRSENAGKKMQEFVIAISNYARIFHPKFIIIPQNGVELAFNEMDPSNSLNINYLNAVNGFGNEEIFYNGELNIDTERLLMLNKLRTKKPVMVADFVNDNNNLSSVFMYNNNYEFLCFPRNSTNYDYTQIPDTCWNENNYAINSLEYAQNYLYLISTNNFSSKQEFINAVCLTNFDVVIIDLFFDDDVFTKDEITKMKYKANGAKRLLISYMNIGSAEKYRYYWKKGWGAHHPLWIKKKYEGYPDEFWVKYWRRDWQDIIYGNKDSYTKKIIDAGFDGAYLDNVEAYYFLYFKD